MSPDEILQRAARILRSQPGYRRAFLEAVGIPLSLTVDYEDAGAQDQSWRGSPEEWLAFVQKEAWENDATLEAVADGDEDFGWRVHSYEIAYVDSVICDTGSHMSPLEPYEAFLDQQRRGRV